MSSNVQPPEGAPVEATPAAPPAPEPPRDDAGRFTAPAAPVVAQPAAPVAPPVAPPPFSPDEATRFYGDFYDPQRRPEAFVRTGRKYGFIPEGVDSADEVQRALAMYAEWKQGQQPAAPQAPAQPGYAQPQQPGYQDQGYIDPDEFRTSIVQSTLEALDQRDAVRAQQAQMQQQVQTLQSSVFTVAQAENLNEEGARVLMQNVAIGIDAAVEAGQRVDFSPEALQQYAGQVLSSLRGLGAAAAQAGVQQQVAQHRQQAPLTTVPTGAPQAGQPGGPRGMAGAVQRAQQGLAAERAGG